MSEEKSLLNRTEVQSILAILSKVIFERNANIFLLEKLECRKTFILNEIRRWKYFLRKVKVDLEEAKKQHEICSNYFKNFTKSFGCHMGKRITLFDKNCHLESCPAVHEVHINVFSKHPSFTPGRRDLTTEDIRDIGMGRKHFDGQQLITISNDDDDSINMDNTQPFRVRKPLRRRRIRGMFRRTLRRRKVLNSPKGINKVSGRFSLNHELGSGVEEPVPDASSGPEELRVFGDFQNLAPISIQEIGEADNSANNDGPGTFNTNNISNSYQEALQNHPKFFEGLSRLMEETNSRLVNVGEADSIKDIERTRFSEELRTLILEYTQEATETGSLDNDGGGSSADKEKVLVSQDLKKQTPEHIGERKATKSSVPRAPKSISSKDLSISASEPIRKTKKKTCGEAGSLSDKENVQPSKDLKKLAPEHIRERKEVKASLDNGSLPNGNVSSSDAEKTMTSRNLPESAIEPILKKKESNGQYRNGKGGAKGSLTNGNISPSTPESTQGCSDLPKLVAKPTCMKKETQARSDNGGTARSLPNGKPDSPMMALRSKHLPEDTTKPTRKKKGTKNKLDSGEAGQSVYDNDKQSSGPEEKRENIDLPSLARQLLLRLEEKNGRLFIAPSTYECTSSSTSGRPNVPDYRKDEPGPSASSSSRLPVEKLKGISASLKSKLKTMQQKRCNTQAEEFFHGPNVLRAFEIEPDSDSSLSDTISWRNFTDEENWYYCELGDLQPSPPPEPEERVPKRDKVPKVNTEEEVKDVMLTKNRRDKDQDDDDEDTSKRTRRRRGKKKKKRMNH